MKELEKLRTMIGNKQSELNKLYAEREKLQQHIARTEGEISGLRDAESAIDGMRTAMAAANAC